MPVDRLVPVDAEGLREPPVGQCAKAALAETALGRCCAAETAMSAETANDMAARYRRIETSSEGTRRESLLRVWGLVGEAACAAGASTSRGVGSRTSPQAAVRRGHGSRPGPAQVELVELVFEYAGTRSPPRGLLRLRCEPPEQPVEPTRRRRPRAGGERRSARASARRARARRAQPSSAAYGSSSSSSAAIRARVGARSPVTRSTSSPSIPSRTARQRFSFEDVGRVRRQPLAGTHP